VSNKLVDDPGRAAIGPAAGTVTSTSPKNELRAERLKKRYRSRVVVKDVSLEVRSGEVIGLLGPNGAGKTTAVRVLATLLRPDAGPATVGGCAVIQPAHEVRQLIGLPGQFASVDE